MIKFSKLFLEYKEYILENSKYNPKIVKDFIFSSTEFPVIDFKYEDSANSNDSTYDGIEYYDNEYFSVTIYAQDRGEISRNIITEELIELTQKFLGKYKGMKRVSCRPIPNLDTSVQRTIIKYQCQYGNVYGNIIRR